MPVRAIPHLSALSALAVLAVLGAAGVLLAGCGGDTGDTVAEPEATVTETPEPSGLPGTRDCGQVGFEPDTDAGAFDIEATGVGCRVARRIARGAEDAQGEPYQAVRGFSCEPTGTVGELPGVVYECTGPADQRVRFEAG